ncbi:MAG: ABC transporter permease [Spirochaetales bacterium]|nr:ABC transporter permease [Spirochaetales bacterium]
MKRSKTFIIAKEEFRRITATKGFIIITILGPFLILAVSVLPGLLSNRVNMMKPGTRITLVGSNPQVTEIIRQTFEKDGILVEEGTDLEAAKEQVLREEELQGVLAVPEDITRTEVFYYYSKTGTDFMISETLKAVLGNLAVSQRMRDAGFEPEQIRSLSAMPDLMVRKLSKAGEEDQDMFSIIMTTIAFIMLLYMTILLYGQMIGNSVIREKTSKTVEIILSSARPNQIMFGKIAGLGTAGLLQYTVWVVMAMLMIKVVGPALSLSLPAALNPTSLLFLVLFFLAAFFLYASAYAALGAAAEDEQNLGQLAWPLIFFLVIPMVMVSPIVMNPTSTFTQVLTYFPMTAPVVMFARVLVSMPKAWELLLCFAILIVSIVLMVYGAAKIFRVGILMTGKRFSFKEIMKWLRYSS